MQYQWYYLDIISEDGTVITIIFYRHPFFLTFELGLLDIVIYKESQKFHWGFPVPLSQCQFQGSPLQIVLGNGLVRQDHDQIQIQIDELSIKVELILNVIFPDWRSVWISLLRKGDDYFDWQIFVPLARVTGEIITEKWQMRVNGLGYLDANRSNFRFSKYIKSWEWGRFSSDDSFFAYGSLAFKNGEYFQPNIKISGDDFRIDEAKFPVVKDLNSFKFINNKFYLKESQKLDEIFFLVSAIPEKLTLLRKIHEYLFYHLAEYKWGDRLVRSFANVKYERNFVQLSDESRKPFVGLIEKMQFSK